jgi:hypothetical protein
MNNPIRIKKRGQINGREYKRYDIIQKYIYWSYALLVEYRSEYCSNRLKKDPLKLTDHH